jgi:hypothetical protein
MESGKDLIKRYTQEYALDEQTRVKAEDFFREYLTKIQTRQPVSLICKCPQGSTCPCLRGIK